MSWLTDTALYTGLLIALALVLRRPVARMFGPGLAYALWALPLLRLALPPIVLPAKPVTDTIVVTAVASSSVQSPAVEAPVWSSALTYAPLFEAVWLAGALAFLGWRTISYLAMRRSLLRGAVGVGREGKVRLVESPATPAPVAFGVIDKVVALPLGFMARQSAARDLAIAHELQHHAGHDLAVNIAMQPLLALHWFNPLAWMGWRALRRDQEAACDARVLAGRDSAIRAEYARLITSFAKGPRLALAAPMACPVLGEKSIIHRLRSLTMTERSKTNRLLGRLLIGAGIIALPLTASVTYAAPDAPTPPTPPAAADAPTPPDAPEAPQVQTRVSMIHGDGKHDAEVMAMGDEKGMTTRTVTRGGRTYVFKTTKPMSDAEVDKRIAELEAAPMPPLPPVPPVPGAAPAAPGAPHEVRTIVMRQHGEGSPEVMAMVAPGAPGSCEGGVPTKVDSEMMEGGKRHMTRIVLCNKGGDKAHTVAALQSARAQIAGDNNIPADAKAQALKQLDEQIAKLSS